MQPLHERVARTLEKDPELLARASLATEQSVGASEAENTKLPAFPKGAWRGLFADYRSAMARATEASDVFHFGSLWARAAVVLGRRVWFQYGMQLFPNVYVVCFGPTGDRKSTATRRAAELGGPFKIVRGGGSGEGLAAEFGSAQPGGEGLLMYAEEFSSILRPGRWDGATLLPFLTQSFDCPERYEMKFRKSPVTIDRPTPSLLAGTTPEWLWQDLRAKDFQGGFGNRIFFLTGARKSPIPLPDSPSLCEISRALDALASVEPCEAQFESKARDLWEGYYLAREAEQPGRDPLWLSATQRVPAYILKLALLYAAAECTLPVITCDQLAAAILVGEYGEACTAELLSLQNTGTNPRKELERRILAFVAARPTHETTKREVYKALWRHYSDAEAFHRAFDSLVRAGELFAKTAWRGSIWVSTEPLE